LSLLSLLETVKLYQNMKEINEILYHQTPSNLHPSIIKELTDIDISTTKILFSGKKYILHQVEAKNNFIYFIITDKAQNIIFYQKAKYRVGKYKIQLLARLNVSETKFFPILIGTLLHLGYTIIDDLQHNTKSMNSILDMVSYDQIAVFIKGRELSLAEFGEIIHIADKNIELEYKQSKRPKEIKLLETYTMFESEDIFETVEFYCR